MVHHSKVLKWVLAMSCAGAFVIGASAQEVARAVSRAVVTPDDPIWASDVQNPTPPGQEQEVPAAQNAGRGRGGPQQPPQPRPYAQVITAQAKSSPGVFTVHRVGESLYYEIPKSELGKDFLWVTQLKATTFGAGYGGQAVNNRVVRWEQIGNRVMLRIENYGVVSSDKSNPVGEAVADANTPPIVASFNVEAFADNGSPVIDVTRLFTSEIPELSARQNVGARGFDASRTFIDKAVAYPLNINVEVTQTYTTPLQDASADRGGGRGAAAGMRGNSGTVVMYYSMVKLPETPMQPRLFDERVGYFTTSTYDYSRPEHKATQRVFITRYRLEKKDPNAALSEPVKPIVYYVDPATPKQWVPWVKRAIEDWQPAFEAAGFKNAIIAKEAPSKAEDPDWNAEDARYSVIRWLPSTTENAVGPHIVDPRSGEIIEADVQLYHNVMNLATMWYFDQVGPLDPRAKKLPLPEDLMGRLLEYVIAHEVGHTLGFQHNMKASSEYTLAQVRDKNWVKENGHTPTLMDYSRFNYVAQPEDGIAIADLVPKIGPYDKWATMWGYKPIAAAKSPDDEKSTLDSWAREQDTKPYLRFSTSGAAGSDPGDETEAVGDADATAATALGMKNLRRVSDMMLDATSTPGESYSDLNEVYGRVVGQWTTEMNHVTNVVGGVLSQEKYVGQQGVRFTPEPKAKQMEAVQFLLANAFQTPDFLVKTDILRRIQPTGVVTRVRTAQNSVMNSLLNPARLDRLVEQNALDPANAYSPVQLLGDVRKGIWSELATPGKTIDTFRRNTQRVYLDTIDNRLNENGATSDEVRALLKGELKQLDSQIRTAQAQATDVATARHLQDARDQIAASLDPHAMRTPPAAATGGRGGRGGMNGAAGGPNGGDTTLISGERYDYDHDPFLLPPAGCWPDLIIR
jgi:hypothetical protein